MGRNDHFPHHLRCAVAAFCFAYLLIANSRAQETAPKPAEKQSEKQAAASEPLLPAQFTLLETHVRFETNGDSRKEVHAIVKINDELGVNQFAHLNFDYNRSFEAIEIPLVRITHSSGGTADILPSAISDNPNPAVINAPAYQDVRVKSVRILGLAPGDTLEYRVITTVSHHPLAPDFWFDHTFDRTGLVIQESFELDLPSSSALRVRINPQTPPDESPDSGAARDGRVLYRWTKTDSFDSEWKKEPIPARPDIAISSFSSWNQLADRLSALLIPSERQTRELYYKAASLAGTNVNPNERISPVYDFVSEKIRTVDLPLGATGFRPRKPAETLAAGYGTAEDKFVLFAAIGDNLMGPTRAGFLSASSSIGADDPPSPAQFDHLLTMSGYPSISFWMDLNVEVAPFLMIPTQFRDRPVFVVGPAIENRWETVVAPLPFPAAQKVEVRAKLDLQGKLGAHVTYVLRGDNELLLRIAFHQTPKEKWKDVAQLLALSDGFRGKIVSATASDPYATKEPFTVEYEIEQSKFVDWSKKPVRIPALLPLLGLPDPPAKPSPRAAASPIELGTPLDVQTTVTLHLPPGTTARVPTGTSVERDYATFSSQYAASENTITASRHIHFLLREVPATRAADYNAFLHAVQSDQAQLFTLDRPSTPAPPYQSPATPDASPSASTAKD